MAKLVSTGAEIEPTRKGTSIGRKNIKLSSMNKSKKRSHKFYRGQGK